jgi:pyrrolysyl-tRNA synthetase-like protein
LGFPPAQAAAFGRPLGPRQLRSAEIQSNAFNSLPAKFHGMTNEKKTKKPAKRFYRKRVELFRLIDKIKLWPSRKGLLHGIKTIEKMGDQAQITTHCNKTFMINDSRSSRAARWLRNKWFKGVCGVCRIPEWKLQKYSSTQFRRHYGSMLIKDEEQKDKAP